MYKQKCRNGEAGFSAFRNNIVITGAMWEVGLTVKPSAGREKYWQGADS